MRSSSTVVQAEAQNTASAPSQPLFRRHWLWLAAVIAAVAAAWNWDWLAALGVAPILISVLPCAAMCALGLCFRSGGPACKSSSHASDRGKAHADMQGPTPD